MSHVEYRAGSGSVRVLPSTLAGSERTALRTKPGAYVQNTVDEKSIADTLAHGRRCVGAQCQQGQISNVFRLQFDLDRRARKRSGGRDPGVLLRELDSRPQPKAEPAQRTRVYPSKAQFNRLLGHGNTGPKIRAVAYHEAAHAVIAVLEGLRLDEVRFNWEGAPGYSWEFKGGKCEIRSGTQTSRFCVASECAEELAGFRPELLDGWRVGDERQARKLTQQGVLADRQRATAMLTRSWPAVRALARALLRDQRVDGDTATAVIMANLDANTRSRLRAAA